MNDFTLIVAYDGSSHADDAVVLGNLLARDCDSSLVLAHAYRTTPAGGTGGENSVRERERFLSARAEELLAHGARLIDPGTVLERRVVGSTTTATGIRTLAEGEGAALVIFGSAAGTLPGRVHPGSASRRLLQLLMMPLAVAPAGFQASHPEALSALAVASDDRFDSARRSAEALAEKCGAQTVTEDSEEANLLFVSSGEDGEQGRLRLISRGDKLIQAAKVPVVVVPYGAPLQLPGTDRSVAAA